MVSNAYAGGTEWPAEIPVYCDPSYKLRVHPRWQRVTLVLLRYDGVREAMRMLAPYVRGRGPGTLDALMLLASAGDEALLAALAASGTVAP